MSFASDCNPADVDYISHYGDPRYSTLDSSLTDFLAVVDRILWKSLVVAEHLAVVGYLAVLHFAVVGYFAVPCWT